MRQRRPLQQAKSANRVWRVGSCCCRSMKWRLVALMICCGLRRGRRSAVLLCLSGPSTEGRADVRGRSRRSGPSRAARKQDGAVQDVACDCKDEDEEGERVGDRASPGGCLRPPPQVEICICGAGLESDKILRIGSRIILYLIITEISRRANRR